MEKILYAFMVTVAMPTCVFAQQTESENLTTYFLNQ